MNLKMVSKDNLSKLLSETSNQDGTGESFDFIYRGQSEIDRHYTKPMLPWIISEIKNQRKMLQVKVKIKDGMFEVLEHNTLKPILQHTIKRIHKCVMEQADHRCFLYTLRPPEKDSLTSVDNTDSYSTTPVPCNININQNYHCHLYQALTEQEVRSFFYYLRQQPRDVKLQDSDSFNSLADLSVHTESQFFEVLFIGRVRVSHCKVPATFIDEALAAFRQKEKVQRRTNSGEQNRLRSSPSRILNFQQDGSGYSVPNIVLRSSSHSVPESRPSFKANNTAISVPENEHMSRSSIKENESGLGELTLEKDPKTSKVRFYLWSSCDEPCDQGSPKGGLSPYTSFSSNSSQSLKNTLVEMGKMDSDAVIDKESVQFNIDKNTVLDDVTNEKTIQPSSNLNIIPMETKRPRHLSSSEGYNDDDVPSAEHVMRSRTGSIGSNSSNKLTRPSDSDLKDLGYDFNRTMLFHIGHREVQLINPELKSVQLSKPFRDIAGCCQGVKFNDHFGFICRELLGESLVYVGYIFKCDRNYVADEIMQVLNRAFSAMHEAQQRDRKEHLMCDYCPLKWFSQLCAEVEGLAAPKAHSAIMKRVVMLPEEDRASILAKYEGAETSDIVQKNNVLMMLLRTHFEYKQSNHSHPSCSNLQRSDFSLGTNIGTSLKKAGKTITTSFNSLLKRDLKDSENTSETSRYSDNASSPNVIVSNNSVVSSATVAEKPPVVEGVSFSPLRPQCRKRSSTISGAEGDCMRKELLAKKAEEVDKNKNSESSIMPPPSGAKMNIFLKFGGQSITQDDNICDKTQDLNRPLTSFRHAILQKVVTPTKGMTDSQSNRKISLMERKGLAPPKRSIDELMLLWKKCIFQQILLLRIERENQRLRAIQKEEALIRVRLNYKEEFVPIEAQQIWELLLSRPHARIDSNVLFSGIKQGVPKSLRGDIWNLLVIQHQLTELLPRQDIRKNKYPHTYNTPYEAMIKELTSQQHAILIDIGRTFPSHPYFTQTLGPGQLALFNILKAYSILDQEVGYCQGLSFVGGVLLMHVDEERAYQLLKYLMYEKGCRKQYRLDLEGLQIRMYQLSRLVHDKLHDLYNHLEEHEVTPQLYAAPWFLTLFASQFPLSFVVRVFDLLFLIGMEAVFCVSLVLLKKHQEELLSLDSFEQIMEYFKTTTTAMECSQLNSFFSEVCECNVRKELSAYEVEYQVLQEELSFSPQQNADIQKLREATKNLKRQNLDLLEQIHNLNNRQNSLENTNQYLQQSQHHLEVRVRWLEMERSNMKNLIHILSEGASKETLNKVPPNLERYLPHKASSPKVDNRHKSETENKNDRSINSTENVSDKAKVESEIPTQPPHTEISVLVPPRRGSSSPFGSIDELRAVEGTFAPSHISCSPEVKPKFPDRKSLSPGTVRKSLSPEPLRKSSDSHVVKSLFADNSDRRFSPDFLSPHDKVNPRVRSSTLDPQSMQNYLKGFMKID